MALSATDWEALRAEYEAGVPCRALGRQYELSDTAIRKRAKRDGWVVRAEAAVELNQLAQKKTLEGAVARRMLAAPDTSPTRNPGATKVQADPAPARPFPRPDLDMRTATARGQAAGAGSRPGLQEGAGGSQGVRTQGLAREPECEPVRGESLRGGLVADFEEARQAIGDAVIVARAEVVARANMRTLTNVDAMQELFDRQVGLLRRALIEVDPDDAQGQTDRGEALNLLLVAKGDSIAGHLGKVSQVMKDIQETTRKALGIDDKVKLELVPGTTPGAPQGTPGERVASLMPLLAKMSTDQLAAIWDAGKLLQGNTERPPIPMPPSGPVPGDDARFIPQPPTA